MQSNRSKIFESFDSWLRLQEADETTATVPPILIAFGSTSPEDFKPDFAKSPKFLVPGTAAPANNGLKRYGLTPKTGLIDALYGFGTKTVGKDGSQAEALPAYFQVKDLGDTGNNIKGNELAASGETPVIEGGTITLTPTNSTSITVAGNGQLALYRAAGAIEAIFRKLAISPKSVGNNWAVNLSIGSGRNSGCFYMGSSPSIDKVMLTTVSSATSAILIGSLLLSNKLTQADEKALMGDQYWSTYISALKGKDSAGIIDQALKGAVNFLKGKEVLCNENPTAPGSAALLAKISDPADFEYGKDGKAKSKNPVEYSATISQIINEMVASLCSVNLASLTSIGFETGKAMEPLIAAYSKSMSGMMTGIAKRVTTENMITGNYNNPGKLMSVQTVQSWKNLNIAPLETSSVAKSYSMGAS